MPPRSPPHLEGARRVLFKLSQPHRDGLHSDIEKVKAAWAKARKLLAKVAGICHCGNRWDHLMDGVEVTLLDRASYTARCWDDDRIWINLPLFSKEPDNGVGALVHEFGHRVYFQCLSDKQQAAWKSSWKSAKKRPAPRWQGECSGTVSSYACTNDLEDFAEVFQVLIMGDLDEYNRKRWADVCGCNKALCVTPVRAAGRTEERRHGDARPRLRWTREEPRASEIARTPGGGPYERSDDGRFVIWVERAPLLRGGLGPIRYMACDYKRASGNNPYTVIHTGTESLDRLKEAVEKWARTRRAD